MADEENGILPDMELMPSATPTADAGTSDDVNWIGTTDNVRPADIHAAGGSGDTPGTIGDAIGPLATPTKASEPDITPATEDDPVDRDQVSGIRAGRTARGDLPPGPGSGETPIGSEGYGAPENTGPGRMPPIGANLAQTGIGGIDGPGGATGVNGDQGADGEPGV